MWSGHASTHEQKREMYVDLSREDRVEGECGKLGKATRGTRDAAQDWEIEYTEMVVGAKFKQGALSACVFYREERNIRAVVYGDEFTVLGQSGDLDWFGKVIEKNMEVKCKERLIRGHEEAVRVLNRVSGQFD